MRPYSSSSDTTDNTNDSLLLYIIKILSDIIDSKDKYSRGHSERVAKYAKEISNRYGYSDEESSELFLIAHLHDVGKIGIPDYIINKNSKLTDSEYRIIKQHSAVGAHILHKIKNNPKFVIGARWHHERYDGSGYPDGLKGKAIPEIARIISVADAYDAMTSNRSYRSALPQNYVRFEIASGKGKQFDPVFADILLQMIDEDKSFSMREFTEGTALVPPDMDFAMSFLMSACPEVALSLKVSEKTVEGQHLSFSVLVEVGQCMPGGFFVYKAGGNEEILYANDIVCSIFGCKDLEEFKEYTGNSFHGMVYEQDIDRIELSIIEQVEKDENNLDYIEYRIRRKNGDIRWVDDYGRHVSTHDYGDVFYVLIRDITEQHIEREILTDVDHLTNVLNRRCFDITLNKNINYLMHNSGSLCMIMIDIDKFKKFNDLYGHLIGDKCLAQVAQAMQNSLRRKSDRLFRYGGEEFAVLLPGALLEDAVKLAERLRLAVRKLAIPHEHGPCGIVTISAGVAYLTSESTKILDNPYADIVKFADQALYEAKEFGRDTVKIKNLNDIH